MLANQSVETNRRPASPIHDERQFGCASCARPFLSAAVAHLYRSATILATPLQPKGSMNMKRATTATLLLVLLTVLAGCASPSRGAASGREKEFRQQLAEAVPIRDYGYTIRELRFSPESKKALVVFTHADAKTRPEWEFVLTADDFGRYRGMNMQPFYTPGTGNTPPIQITVTLPPH